MRRGIVSAAALAVCVLSTSAHAVVSKLDTFEIRKNGITSFLDEFSDGVVPSAATGWVMNLGSVPAGSEANSLLTLDSANGGATVDALGRARQAVVFSRATPLSQAGLASDDDIQITGVFELVTPTGPQFNAYGIRVAAAGLPAQRVAQLHVEYNTVTGAPTIRYILQDFGAGTITNLGSTLLAPTAGADRVLLSLTRSASSDQFFASYAFGSGGSFGDGASVGSGARMFVGQDYVRGQVITVAAPIPEASTWAMLTLGLAGIAALRRRQAKAD